MIYRPLFAAFMGWLGEGRGRRGMTWVETKVASFLYFVFLVFLYFFSHLVVLSSTHLSSSLRLLNSQSSPDLVMAYVLSPISPRPHATSQK